MQLQNPVIDPSRFDLVVVPRHDGLTGPNVMSTRGGLHRVTPAMMASEAEKLAPQVAHLPSPRIAVLIGGSNAVYKLTPKSRQKILRWIAEAASCATGGSLMVTPSRRTGGENLAAVAKRDRQCVPAYIWDGQGPNPYYGMLGLADYIIATCDSVNMVSEACTTGKPVYVIDLPGGSEKFKRFHANLRTEGRTRQFAGRLEHWQYIPLDEVKRVAERIKEMMEKRHGAFAGLIVVLFVRMSAIRHKPACLEGDAPVAREPFPYFIVPNLIRAEALAAVEADYTAVDQPGSFPLASVSYGPSFERLMEDIQGREMAEVMGQKFGLDLTRKPTMVTVRGRTDAHDGRIHSDSKTKLITVLIYMNGKWEKPGGRLRLLRSPDNLKDMVAEVPPDQGTLLAFKNQPNAWHGHEEYIGPRRAIQLNWVRDRGVVWREQLRHRLSAMVKKFKK